MVLRWPKLFPDYSLTPCFRTCRKRADALYGRNSSFKSQVTSCFNVSVINTNQSMAYLMSVLLSN